LVLKKKRKKVDEYFLSLEKMTADFQPYLMAACRYFHQQSKPQLLYVLQIFMGDHLRAAMSCVKIFLKKYLQKKQKKNNKKVFVLTSPSSRHL
jgi:hypothetical protein